MGMSRLRSGAPLAALAMPQPPVVGTPRSATPPTPSFDILLFLCAFAPLREDSLSSPSSVTIHWGVWVARRAASVSYAGRWWGYRWKEIAMNALLRRVGMVLGTLGLVLAVSAWAGEPGGKKAPATGTVSIDAAKKGEPISKYVYGQFIEHLGRCIYGGIWAEMLEDRKFFYPVGAKQSPWKSLAGPGTVEMVRENAFVGQHTPKITAAKDRPAGMVRHVSERPEDRQHAVAHEFVERTLILEDGICRDGKILIQYLHQSFRRQLLAQLRKVANIGKENGDCLSLPAQPQLVRIGRKTVNHGGCNVTAEHLTRRLKTTLFRQVVDDDRDAEGSIIGITQRRDAETKVHGAARLQVHVDLGGDIPRAAAIDRINQPGQRRR